LFLVTSDSDAKLVAEQIEILLTYTVSDFTNSEIAEIFNAPEDVVDQAMQQLSFDLAEHQIEEPDSALLSDS